MKIRPRGDFVLFRQVRENVKGLLMPDQAKQGKVNTVVALGPDVEDLKIGDQIEFAGSMVDGSVAQVPNEKDLFLTRQENVILVYEAEQEPQSEIPVPTLPESSFAIFDQED